LDLGLDVVDGIRGLDLKGDGFASECLDKDLHSIARCQPRISVDARDQNSHEILESRGFKGVGCEKGWLLGSG
jgi:hypothetical protein